MRICTQRHLHILQLFLCLVVFPGLPKAAVVNQNRLLIALAVLSSNGVTSSDVIYVNLPLYHTAGFLIGFIGSFETGEAIAAVETSDLRLCEIPHQDGCFLHFCFHCPNFFPN